MAIAMARAMAIAMLEKHFPSRVFHTVTVGFFHTVGPDLQYGKPDSCSVGKPYYYLYSRVTGLTERSEDLRAQRANPNKHRERKRALSVRASRTRTSRETLGNAGMSGLR
jgi:hypothetical protein